MVRIDPGSSPSEADQAMIAAALEDLDWHEDAVSTLLALADRYALINADDLRREMRPAPHPNHYGAAFTAAKAHGYIEPVGYQTSTAPSRHRGILRTWRLKSEGVTK